MVQRASLPTYYLPLPTHLLPTYTDLPATPASSKVSWDNAACIAAFLMVDRKERESGEDQRTSSTESMILKVFALTTEKGTANESLRPGLSALSFSLRGRDRSLLLLCCCCCF